MKWLCITLAISSILNDFPKSVHQNHMKFKAETVLNCQKALKQMRFQVYLFLELRNLHRSWGLGGLRPRTRLDFTQREAEI